MSISPAAQTRIGLVGCGVIAYWAHLRSLPRIRNAKLVAAADPNENARQRAKRLVGVPIYERAEDLFGRNDIEAVVICAPTHLHAKLAIAAGAAGKHFYLEKPIATNAADAERVIEQARLAPVIGVIGFNRRWHPLYEQARQLIRDGRIGRVRAIQTAFCERIPIDTMPEWKRRRATGGGVLLDLASHHIDLLRWFLDDEVDEVGASVGSEISEQDSARLELTTRGGVEVQSVFSFRAGLADFFEIIGERGTLRVDRHAPTLALRIGRRLGYGMRSRWVAPDAAVEKWRLKRLLRPSADPSYHRSLQAFVAVVRGRQDKVATLLDGVRSLEVILRAEQSGRSEERIFLQRDRGGAPCGPY